LLLFIFLEAIGSNQKLSTRFEAWFTRTLFFIAPKNKIQNSINPWAIVLSSCLVLIILLSLYNINERIPEGNGFGIDGKFYGGLAMDFFSKFEKGVNNYHLQRILPSTVIFFTLDAFSIPKTITNVINAFSILNSISVAIMVFVWGLTAQRLNISQRGWLIGLIGLVVNLAALKMAGYYPVLTDIPSYMLGMLLIFFYLVNNRIGVYIVSLLGLFTWPFTLYIGSILLLFPVDLSNQIERNATSQLLRMAASIIATLTICFFVFYSIFLSFEESVVSPPLSRIIPGLIVVCIYSYFAFYHLFADNILFSLKTYARSIIRLENIVFLSTFICIRYLQNLIGTDHIFTYAYLLDNIFTSSVTWPGIFIVAHTAYFGPLVIFVVSSWKEFTKAIFPYGLGICICIAVSILLSLNSQSRNFILNFPFFIPFTAMVIDRLEINKVRILIFVFLSLIISKVWLPLNSFDNWRKAYISLHGPWMTFEDYLINLVITLGIGLAIYIWLRRQSPKY
jgi:hypothetical protein